MAADDMAVGAQVSPSLTALEELLLPHMDTLTKAQQPFTDYNKAGNVLASSRGSVELKRLLSKSKRDDCLRILKRLLDNLSDPGATKDTLRVLYSLQYDKTQLRASRLGPVLQTLSREAEEVTAEDQEVLQQNYGVSRSVFGRQWYLIEYC